MFSVQYIKNIIIDLIVYFIGINDTLSIIEFEVWSNAMYHNWSFAYFIGIEKILRSGRINEC